MLRHSLGGEAIFFFAEYFGFLLELNALFVCLSCSLLPACPPNVGNIQLFNGNLINLTIFGGKALVNKLWPLLYKRAELDLRLTKLFTFFIPGLRVTE